MKAHLRWVATFFVVLTFSLSLLAQDTGQLTGTVHDPSGAAIPNAQVVVSNSSRGINRPTTSNASGDWLVSGLPSGSYDLAITAPGFKRYQARGIVLRIGQKLRADANLEVGAASTEITVQGTNVAQVETQSSDLAGTVTGKQISQLMLNGRNFTQLAALVPGVSNQSGQDDAQVGVNGSISFSFNGGRTEYNNWEIDGGDNMDNGSNTSLNVYPSIDAIAEVRVLTSNYGAQYGRNGSGTVETDTKSGTSAFHGDVYEFVRNDVFNAKNFFESSVPSYKKNDYGYTIGGPAYIPGVYNKNKDKTFFFWSEEWRKDRVPGQTFNVPVPSAAERNGDFRDLCPNVTTSPPSMQDCPIDPTTGLAFPGNQVPVAPMAKDLLALIPPPNAGVPGAALFDESPIVATNWREELLRVDHNFSSKWRFMFRWIHDSWDTVTPTSLWTGSAFPTVQTQFSGPAVSMVARLTTNVSPTLLNEFMMSYTTDHIILGSTGTPVPTAWQRPASLPMGFLFNNGGGGKLPAISLTGGAAYNGGFFEDPNGTWPEGPYNSNPTYTYRDNVTKIAGRHNLQFGAYAVTAQKNELGGLQLNGLLNYDISSPVSTGNPFADLLTGRISEFDQGSKQIKFYQRYKILEPYFQDDWRVTDKLTLNLGMRVSLFGTYREKYNNAYNWDPAAYNPATAPKIDVDGSVTGFAGALIPGSGNKFDGLVHCGVDPGVPVGCIAGHVFNPAPRVGFAYDPSGNGKTAIRGGYGIFWEHTNGNEASTEGLEGQSSPLLQTSNQHNIVGYTNIGGGGTTPIEFPISFESLPGPKVIWPYMQQWHLDVQHEVAHNTVAMVSYVGSKGTHLTRLLDLNQIPSVPLAQNPYKPGEPIGGAFNPVSGTSAHDDCSTMTTPSGVQVTGQAAIDLQVACGADPNPFRPFQGVASITRLENKSSSIYHAFQTSVRRSVGALQLNVAYTYSHSIDDSSSRYDGGTVDSYNPAAFRASSNFDIRHMLAVSYIYDLPFFKSGGLTSKILGGWQISGITSWQSGTPVSISNSAAFSDNAGVANDASSVQFANSYPDVVGSPGANVPNVAVEGFGPLIANPGAFVAPRGLTFGDAGRNSLTNPSWSNWNMALFKHFAIHEQVALEFRAEAFNVWNHTEWAPLAGNAGSIGNNLSSGTNSFSCYGGANNSGADPSCLNSSFLHVGATHPARILQLGMKFLF